MVCVACILLRRRNSTPPAPYATSHGRLVPRPLTSRAVTHGEAVRSAHGRGSARPADARCEPREVAPRAYDLVLRDRRARRAGSRIQLPVQQLLRGARAAGRAREARDAVTALARARPRVSRGCRSADRRSDRPRRPRAARARPPARAATSGADPDGCEVRARHPAAAPGVKARSAPRTRGTGAGG